MALQSGLDNDQASFRRRGIIYDQHESPRWPKGRPWFANIDKKSGFPVGGISPKGWSAPWIPDQGIFRFADEDPTRFKIDYEALLQERLQAHQEYTASLEQTALARGWDPYDGEKQPILQALVGKPPLPVEPIVAAMQGNKWILGLTDVVDPRVEKFVVAPTRREKLLAGLPDFSSDPEPVGASGILEDQEVDAEDELDKLLDFEEAADPEATGGKKVKPKKAKAA